jgi:hypothetical protein
MTGSMQYATWVAAILGTGFLVAGAIASSTSAAEDAPQNPVACQAGALSPEEWERHVELRGQLVAGVTERIELENGYRFVLDRDKLTAVQLAEWVEGERRCCPFIEFEIRQAADGGPLSLTLTGREGVKELLETAMGE